MPQPFGKISHGLFTALLAAGLISLVSGCSTSHTSRHIHHHHHHDRHDNAPPKAENQNNWGESYYNGAKSKTLGIGEPVSMAPDNHTNPSHVFRRTPTIAR